MRLAAPLPPSARSGKQTLGPGTYYLAVTGLPTDAANGVTYKLLVNTKASKKAPTFDSPTDNPGTPPPNPNPSPNPGNPTGGQHGGVYADTLRVVRQFSPSLVDTDSWTFVASQTGQFDIDAFFDPDITWQFSGGGSGAGGNGAIPVNVAAGASYTFTIKYTGAGSSPYLVTFDTSFWEMTKTTPNKSDLTD